MNKMIVVLPLVLCACNKASQTPPETPTPTAVQPAAPVGTPAPAAAGAALLNDDRLQRFAVYRRETLSMTTDVMGMAMNAGAKAMAGDPTKIDQKKFEGEMVKDDRLKTIEAKNNAALQKAGLTQAEVSELTQLTTEYYTKAMMAADAQKELEGIHERVSAAKAKKKQPGIMDTSMQKTYEEQVSKFDEFKKEFGIKHGADALAAVVKHEVEFIKINEEMIGSLTNKPADKVGKKAIGKAPAKNKKK